jgi:hypothetical protein
VVWLLSAAVDLIDRSAGLISTAEADERLASALDIVLANTPKGVKDVALGAAWRLYAQNPSLSIAQPIINQSFFDDVWCDASAKKDPDQFLLTFLRAGSLTDLFSHGAPL